MGPFDSTLVSAELVSNLQRSPVALPDQDFLEVINRPPPETPLEKTS